MNVPALLKRVTIQTLKIELLIVLVVVAVGSREAAWMMA